MGRTTISQHGIISRQRLLGSGGGYSKPITLVSAPAGYGKTTLLRQLTPDPGPVVRLDPAEISDGWQFWHQVTDALSLPAVTVIIDDLHLLAGERNNQELTEVLRRAGGRKHIVIATRSDPIVALREARLAGEVREIRADELAFDESETAQFLATNEIVVTPEQTHALWIHTEGWPAGLRLSTTPLSRGADSQEAFSTLLHGDTAVGSYLMGQALAYTSDGLRDFLLRTSVTEFLDADLAQELSDRPDSALLLEQVHSQPGFLHRLSAGRWPYRYHPMFRALLLAELTRSAPAVARRLSSVAAARLLAHGEHTRAAQLAGQGKAWKILGHAILAGSCVSLATGDWTWTRTESGRLPSSYQESSLSIRLSSALMMLGTGARSDAMASVSALLSSATPSRTRLESKVLRFLEAWLLAELGETQRAIGLLGAGWDDHSALALTAGEQVLHAVGHQLHAACRFVENSASEAEAVLNESGIAGAEAYPNVQLGELEIRAWVAISAGDLHLARQYLDRAATIIDRENSQRRTGRWGTIWAAWSWLALDTDVQPPPKPEQERPAGHTSVFPQPISRALETITDARMRLVRDKDATGSALILDELVRAQPEIRQWRRIGVAWAVARIDTHIAVGELSDALELALDWSSTSGAPDAGLNGPYLWAWVMQRAVLDHEPGTASGAPELLIGRLPIESSLLPGRSEALRIRVLLGAASMAHRAGSSGAALHYLRLALLSTESHHWRRPYEEIAAHVAPVLEAERSRISDHGELVMKLLGQLRRQPDRRERLVDPLSVRELQILQYLPTALDQRELSSALFISRNTLKTHLRSTYRKLGVQTRREAVHRAERLGIL